MIIFKNTSRTSDYGNAEASLEFKAGVETLVRIIIIITIIIIIRKRRNRRTIIIRISAFTVRWIQNCLRVCRIASIVLTVDCLTPETLHTLGAEETTHTNSGIIITARLGVPL